MADANASRSRCASRVLRQQLLTVPLESAGVARPENTILQGRVKVNGREVTSKWERVDLTRDAIELDGQPLAIRFCRYVLFNKPYDVMSHFTDQHDRATVADYVDVPDIYAAGRLDRDSEGLLLLTDDGWLIHRVTTPRYAHPRTYLAQVERVPSEEALQALRDGVTIKKYRTRPAQVTLLAEPPDLPPRPVPIRFRKNVPTAWMRITLTEGRTRQVRRMTAAVGFPTLRLVRVAIGSLKLEGLAPGEWRKVSDKELGRLRAEIGR